MNQTPPLTEHQADQLRRLKDTLAQYLSMEGKLAVVHQGGVRETDVPEVYRELQGLGLVTITLSGSIGRVAPA